MRSALVKGALTSGTTMVIRSRRRHGPGETNVSSTLPYLLLALAYSHSTSVLRRTKSASGPLVFLLAVPPGCRVPPLSHSLVHCIPLCSNYEKECSFSTRRGIHNGQQPLETIIDPRILLQSTWTTTRSSAPEFLIRLHRPPTTNLSESTFDQRLRLARRCRRLAFLITVMVHATGVETPIVRWRLRC